MTGETREPTRPRSLSARAGITALNLIVPGLGLLRIGDWRAGLFAVFVPFVFAALITFGFGHLPIASFTGALVALTVAITLLVILYIIPMTLTWRRSRLHAHPPGWSRWYGLAAIAVGVLGLWQLMPLLLQTFYKPFYAPSESMAPTIETDDKFVADMRWRGPLKRGQVVLIQAAGSVRVSRIVAVAGDKVALRNGVPVLNGVAVAQQQQGTKVVQELDGSQRAFVVAERLPGERSAHRLLDFGASALDDMPEAVVPPGHVYVLGDNRDRSADSRLSPQQLGVGMVPKAAILGKARYIHWSVNRAKVGSRLDR